MTMQCTIFAASLVCAAVFAGPALADDDARCRGDGPWMSVSEIATKAEAAGYKVREVERDDGCYEIKGRDSNGRKVEVHFNPRTAEVVKVEDED